MNIATLIKDNRVHFRRYRANYFYYGIVEPGTAIKYEFPVPLEEVGDATLFDSEKAIMFMRYIRKAIEDKTLIDISDQED